MEVSERIAKLRSLMKERDIQVYYIPNEDDHLSQEYTADYFKCKSYMSGFSGDAGCTIITKDFAGVWTDGRYFTQAEIELQGSEVQLMRMGQEGVPDAVDFIIEKTPKGGKAAFDGNVVSAGTAIRLSKELKTKGAKVKLNEDLVGMVWGEERPAMPQEKLYVLEEKYTGESASERISRVRAEMKNKGADVLVLTALEDPCWMLNIRGNDIPCTPVPYAFAVVTMRKVLYYVDEEKLTDEVREHFAQCDVTVRPYAALAEDLQKVESKTVWASLSMMNAMQYESLTYGNNQILNQPSPIVLFRAVKNETEVMNNIHAHVKDGVAMVKFIKWLKEAVKTGTQTEITAQDYLYARRAEGEDYIEPSFHTISAYGANGAMMHYSADEESPVKLEAKGFLLVDSGGTYKDGTTDITRTISLGELTDEEKRYYTLVLKGHLDLTSARFLSGTTGNNLDILARKPLWDEETDYQCGTGHGVGYVLGVHEGPHGIRWGLPTAARPSAVLEPGMIVTNEPGVYLPYELGIRIENELLVRKGNKNFYGQWLYFEDITYCPYDLEAIDVKYLDDHHIDEINAYHQRVYETLAPLLGEEDRTWLAHATRKIER